MALRFRINLFLLILSVFSLSACFKKEAYRDSNHQESIQIEPMVREVCHCFEERKNEDLDMMDCYELQDMYWNSIEDSVLKRAFIDETFNCFNSN